MAEKNVAKTSKELGLSAKKKPYARPVFQVYGKVSELTNSSGSHNGDGGQSMMIAPSDPILKENIVRIVDHPLGIGLYLFDFKPEYRNQFGYGRKFGVMADEVEGVVPEAVSVHPRGYKTVNYGMLGVTLCA